MVVIPPRTNSCKDEGISSTWGNTAFGVKFAINSMRGVIIGCRPHALAAVVGKLYGIALFDCRVGWAVAAVLIANIIGFGRIGGITRGRSG